MKNRKKVAALILAILATFAVYRRIASSFIMLTPEGPFESNREMCYWLIAPRISASIKDICAKTNNSDSLIDRLTRDDPRFTTNRPAVIDREIVELFLFFPHGVSVGFPGPLIACTGSRSYRNREMRCGFLLIDDEVYVCDLPPEWNEGIPWIREKCDAGPDVYFSTLAAPGFSYNSANDFKRGDIYRHVYHGPSPFRPIP